MWYAVATYLGLVAVTSIASFVAFGLDKRRAGTGARRVPERTLLLLSLAGGWPGAILARRHFRHKTRKPSFAIAFWVVVVLHAAVVGTVAYALYGQPGTEATPSRQPISPG